MHSNFGRETTKHTVKYSTSVKYWACTGQILCTVYQGCTSPPGTGINNKILGCPGGAAQSRSGSPGIAGAVAGSPGKILKAFPGSLQ